MTTYDRIRASDADRERVTARLREHYAEGRLTREELDERIAAALGARTYGDLSGLMDDLPEPGTFPAGARWPVAAPERQIVVHRGPRLAPLALGLLFLSLLLPGPGWMLFGFFHVLALFALLAAGAVIVTASRARRRLRQWQQAQQGQHYAGRWG